jgi:peptide/nickel transport system permease protein
VGRGQLRYIARRVLRGVSVVIGLIVVTFFLSRAVADPANAILPPGASQEQRDRVTEQLGLDRPLMTQFVDYMGDVVRGDFGESIWLGQPALDVVLDRLPASLLLASVAVGVALLVGLLLGLAAGLRPGSLVDRIVLVISAGSVAIPDFWLGIVLILVFAVNLGWFPTSGFEGAEWVVLPAAALAVPATGRLARVIRESVLDEMGKPYVVAARARGLRTGGVVRRHVLKNISIAISTVAGYDFLFMFTGYAIGVEVVFNWPGVGRLAVDASLHDDVTLVSSIVLILGIIVAVGNTLIDVLHAGIDRRVRA